jgi:putative Mg2+ transporter-C (MgtC) family protein
VKGLTTAASIWAVAAVGLAVGGGMLLAGVATTVLSLVILAFVRPVKKRLFPNRGARFVTLVIDRNLSLAQLSSEIDATKLHLDRIHRSASGSYPRRSQCRTGFWQGQQGRGPTLANRPATARLWRSEVHSLLDGSAEPRGFPRP